MNLIQRIELLDTSVWLHTSAGLSAAAAELFLLHHFHQQPDKEKMFRTHVANNIAFRAIEALIGRSVIGTYEAIREEEIRAGALGFPIPGLDELKGHRTYNSHPQNVTWDKKYMQDFVANELHYRDIKALRLYQARQALIDQLQQLGSKRSIPQNGAVATNAIIELILLCLRESAATGVSVPSEMRGHAVGFFDHFNKLVSEMARRNEAFIGAKKETDH